MRKTIQRLLSVVVIILCIGTMADPLPMNDKVIANSIIVGRGSDLVRLKNLGTITNGPPFSSWSFPSSIEFNGDSYEVWNDGGVFAIMSHTNSSVRLIFGSVSMVNDYHNAMVCGLGTLSLNNMNVWSVANGIAITRFGTGSGTFYHASLRGSRFSDALICKNMYIRMVSDSVTNNFDFAFALLNAGLPESERLALP